MEASVLEFVCDSLRKDPIVPQTLQEELPPGWRRMESRSKPGTFYYAHLATKRTQVQPPPGTHMRHVMPVDSASAPLASVGADVQQSIDAENATPDAAQTAIGGSETPAGAGGRGEVAEQKRPKRRSLEEEQEAEEEQVEAEKRRAKAAKKAREAEERRAKLIAERLEQERFEREAQEAAERQKQEEDERRQQLEAEKFVTARRKAEAEKNQKAEEARRRKAMIFEVQRKLFEEDKKRQAAEEVQGRKRTAEEAIRKQQLRKEEERAAQVAKVAALEADIWSQSVPADPVDPVEEPCFEVYRAGRHVRTHILSSEKERWIIGRGPGGVDVALVSDVISKRHAEVTLQKPLVFLTDLDSTRGTAVDGKKLEARTPVELCDGSRVRFGGLPQLYVFREPAELSSPQAKGEAEAGQESPEAQELNASPNAVAAEEAAAAAEDEARVRRIQQRRQERKAAEAAAALAAARKKAEERNRKQRMEEERAKRLQRKKGNEERLLRIQQKRQVRRAAEATMATEPPSAKTARGEAALPEDEFAEPGAAEAARPSESDDAAGTPEDVAEAEDDELAAAAECSYF